MFVRNHNLVKMTGVPSVYIGKVEIGSATTPTPTLVQKVISSAGFFGIFGVIRKREVIETKKFDADVDNLTIATLFVYSCKAELSIAGEKVGEAEAGYNKIATKTIDLGEIPTGGEQLDIELKCIHVIGSGLRYAACASVVGVRSSGE